MAKRSGVLELAVLGLLQESPMHGYELRKRLHAVLGPFRALSYGSLYPALRDLVARGCITETPTEGAPPRRQAGADRLPAHRRRQGAPGRPARRGRPGGVGGRELRRPLRVLRPDRRRGPAAHPGGPAQPARGAPRHACAPPAPAAASASTPTPSSCSATASRASSARCAGSNELIADERLAGRPTPGSHHRPAPQTPLRANPGVTSRPPQRSRSDGWAPMNSVRVAIVGVGNCAASLVQGVEYYKDADPDGRVPGLMHVQFGDVPRPRRASSSPRSTSTPRRSARTSPRPSSPSENNTIKICDVPPTGVTVQRGHTLDGLGKYYRETIDESDEEPVDVVAGAQGRQGRRPRLLPAGRLGGGRQVLRPVRHRRRGRLRQRAAGLHRRHPEWADEVRRRPASRSSATTSSRQVGATITHRVLAKLFEDRGVTARPHLPAQRRRQHGLHEHARARAPGVQEDLQDPVRHLAAARPRSRPRNVHIGPSDYVAWLDDRKWAFVRLEGRDFGDVPLNAGVQARGLGLARTRPASSSTRSAPRRSPRTAASAARSCRPRPTS